MWCSVITMVIVPEPRAANQNLSAERHLKRLQAIEAHFPRCSTKREKAKPPKSPCLALLSKTKPGV